MTENVCLAIEEVAGLDKIEKLQEHDNRQVYEMALKIIETYYGGEVSKHAGLRDRTQDHRELLRWRGESTRRSTSWRSRSSRTTSMEM